MIYTNKKVKQLLKSELVKRGISTAELVILLNEAGLQETHSSVTSKISRGTFSATFFMQCLSVIHCHSIQIDAYETPLSIAAESIAVYKTTKNDQ